MAGRKRSAWRHHFPATLRRAIFARDGHTCAMCGRSPRTSPALILHVDHIIPLCLGGAEYDLDNLLTLCASDNCSFGGRRKPRNIEAAMQLIAALRNRRGASACRAA